ncbi:hypothetical protein GWK47_006955 [Chionoecetes opilio]|uniref:Uncharacterized protein n=1 Tax=Chionoecetes opilio TaxID=41210 RepID=A0A8J4YF17_CHIOP|nr:hypothetical protein GWK47_006955 [Chionoecetes opilio]
MATRLLTWISCRPSPLFEIGGRQLAGAVGPLISQFWKGSPCRTKRHLTTRIAEHRGLSHRTGKPCPNHHFQPFGIHSEASGHPISNQDFNILHTSSHDSTRWICESLLTHHHKPSLCAQGTSTPLLCF